MRFRFTVQREMAKLPSPFSQTQESGSPNKIQIKGRALCQDQGPGGFGGLWVSPCPRMGSRLRGPLTPAGMPWRARPRAAFCSRSLCKTPIFSPKSLRRGEAERVPEREAKWGCTRPEGMPVVPRAQLPSTQLPWPAASLGAAVLLVPGCSCAGRVSAGPAKGSCGCPCPCGCHCPHGCHCPGSCPGFVLPEQWPGRSHPQPAPRREGRREG